MYQKRRRISSKELKPLKKKNEPGEKLQQEAEARELQQKTEARARAIRQRIAEIRKENLRRQDDLQRQLLALKELEFEAELLRKKRLGRPTKSPIPGQRIRLGLRVKPELKTALSAAAKASGRSMSQEAELRLENSLKSDSSLMLVQGQRSTPVFYYENKVLVPVGYEAVAVEVEFGKWIEVLHHFREQWFLGTPWTSVSDREGWLLELREDLELEPDEGVSLGLRVTPDLKRALDHAADEGEISQSLEAGLRLENSLKSDTQLMLVQGHRATPITFDAGEMHIPIAVEEGYSREPSGPFCNYEFTQKTVALPISSKDQARIQSYFQKQWPEPSFRDWDSEFIFDREEEEWDRAMADYAAEFGY
jgi:uncharacterized protein (DUF1778 family)